MREAEKAWPDRSRRNFLILLISAWIISIFVIGFSIYDKYALSEKERVGETAVALAIDISQRFEIDKSEVERLSSLDFNDLLMDSANVEFESKARAVMEHSDVKYIYVESVLPGDKVKYRVEKGEEGKYGVKAGTPLNVIYLLDAVVSDAVREEDTQGKGYTDKDRYTVMYPQYAKICDKGEPAYLINEDEWGSYITGYAPLHDSEGSCIGLLGVDIFIDDYVQFTRNTALMISGFMLVNLLLSAFAISLIFKIREAEKVASEKTILSNIDSLTSVFSRHRFMEIFEYEWNESQKSNESLGLLLVDVDYFKEFNDNNGHIAGDDVLKKVGGLLIEKSKKYLGATGRYGGDEFVVLFPRMDQAKLQKIANEIVRDTINLGIEHKYSPICPKQTVSVGAASVVPSSDIDKTELIARADKALYKSKRYGRNRASVWEKSS